MRPYSIVRNRTTTINHAFAACIALNDSFDAEKIKAAIVALKQDPEKELVCVYCGEPAQTWDHVHATVRNSVFSGHGNNLGNLLPCCKLCNSRKGNKPWKVHLANLILSDDLRVKRYEVIDSYLEAYKGENVVPKDLPEYQELQKLKAEVLKIFVRADLLAEIIRSKSQT